LRGHRDEGQAGGFVNLALAVEVRAPHSEGVLREPALDIVFLCGQVRHLVNDDALRVAAILGIPLSSFLEVRRFNKQARAHPVAVSRNGDGEED